ncbi:hypothetical protein TUM20983_42480 [Mycobacterium antarcticum]|uniref:hypothetical protein n=1 Tax=Mycolicibacterium sp. TUM20983 TaxID=3023369 RepID=UPI00239AC732|nr:hypothetical protein [Mycolicibacterium sp. TUM20983]GLP77138.1 hypothetical protein TUM20983_42480 [Mycolicibacterium sp. TUM20983]
MSFLKLVVSFAPWIAFLILARDTMHRVEIGLVVALGLTVLMAALRLHRGIIMWVGLMFFAGATVAVLGFHNAWVIRHLGVLANVALAIGSWTTLLIGKPFTLEYARQHTDPSKWNSPLFIRTNEQLTAVWASVFTVNTLVAWLLMKHLLLPEWASHALSYAVLVGAATFTSWYPGHLRKRVASQHDIPAEAR